MITYDENGFYGHPDHIQAHRITMAAVEKTGIPAKVYWTTFPRSWMAGFEAKMRELGVDWDEPATDEPAEGSSDPQDFGLPDEEVTTWVDTKRYGDQKFDSLAAHASQSENIFFLRMGREQFTELMGTETFVRVADRTNAPIPEDDLFGGLR